MIEVAQRLARRWEAQVNFECCGYHELADKYAGRFDGLWCIGNSLAAAGSADAAQRAVDNFAAVLRPGGRMFVQVLNFPAMRHERPCLRGPRVTQAGGVEYVSVRHFTFVEDAAAGPQGRADVTNVTLWRDRTWQHLAHQGSVYPMTPAELRGWCEQAGLTVRESLGAYDRTTFDPETSIDFIVIAERNV